MPDAALTPEQKQQALADAYDIEPLEATSSTPVQVTPGEPSPPESRPRNPDGTFATVKQAPTLSDALKARAARAGLSEADVDGKTPDQVHDLIHHLNEQALRLTREQHAHVKEMQPLLERKEPWKDWDFGTEKSIGEDGKEVERKITADEVHPGLLNVLSRLEQRIRQLEGFEGKRLQMSLTEQCDREFNKHPEWFGKGGFEDISPASPEMARRKAVAEMAKNLGDEPLPKRIAKAKEILFNLKTATPSEEPQTPAPSAKSKFVEEWENAALSPPTRRSSRNRVNGRSKAEESVRQYQQDRMAVDHAEEQDDDPESKY